MSGTQNAASESSGRQCGESSDKQARALVIGADGLLGSHVVRKLLAEGWQTRVLVQPVSASVTLQGLPIEVVRGDLLGPVEELHAAVRGCSHVIHAAAVTDIWASAMTTWKVNLEGTRRVVRACLSSGVERLVFVGSASSFASGGRDCLGDERSPFPKSAQGVPYMESKFRAMKLVQRHVREEGLNAVIVAPTFMLGDFDARPSSGELIRQFIQRGLRVVPSGGRNFSCAADVATATVAAVRRGEKGHAYILGGHNLSYRQFFDRVAQIVGMPAPLAEAPAPFLLAAGGVGSLYTRLTGRRVSLNLTIARHATLETFYDTKRARDVLGLPVTSIDTAITSSIAGLRRYGHLA